MGQQPGPWPRSRAAATGRSSFESRASLRRGRRRPSAAPRARPAHTGHHDQPDQRTPVVVLLARCGDDPCGLGHARWLRLGRALLGLLGVVGRVDADPSHRTAAARAALMIQWTCRIEDAAIGVQRCGGSRRQCSLRTRSRLASVRVGRGGACGGRPGTRGVWRCGGPEQAGRRDSGVDSGSARRRALRAPGA